MAAAPQDVFKEIANHIRVYNADGPVIYRQDIETPNGKMLLFFQDKLDTSGLKDHVGRSIPHTHGICVTGEDAEKFVFHPHYLEEAERLNAGYFKEFWQWTDPSHPAINVTDTIPYKPELEGQPTQAEVKVRPPIDVRGSGQAAGKGSIPDESTAPQRGGESREEAPKGSKKSGESPGRNDTGGEVQGVRKGGEGAHEGALAFKKIAAIAIGVIGIGLLGHGVMAAINAKDTDDRGEEQRNIAKTLLHLGEAGIGVGMTWLAYVKGRGHLGPEQFR